MDDKNPRLHQTIWKFPPMHFEVELITEMIPRPGFEKAACPFSPGKCRLMYLQHSAPDSPANWGNLTHLTSSEEYDTLEEAMVELDRKRSEFEEWNQKRMKMLEDIGYQPRANMNETS